MKEFGNVVQFQESAAWKRVNHEPFLGGKEAMKKRIQDSIIVAKNRLLEGEKNSIKSKLGFDLDLHTTVYKTLHASRYDMTGAYQEVKEGVDGQMKFDMETHIGERLNVASSRFRYEIKDGLLYAPGGNEPVIQIIKRGRDYRKLHRESYERNDEEREAMEVIGMEKIEKIAADPKTPIGTPILSASPRGEKDSIYQHNFLDKFIVSQDENGNRFLEVERLLTDLTKEEFAERLSHFDSRYSPEITPTDSYFLSNPVMVKLGENGINTADELVAFMHKDHDYMSYEEYRKVIKICTPFILAYIRLLNENPDDTDEIIDSYHVILNIADDVAEKIQEQKRGVILLRPVEEMGAVYMYNRNYWAKKEVREAEVGCGRSGAAGSILSQAFSVIEFGFGSDKFGDRVFSCPECGYVNLRPLNTMIERCQNNACRSTKVGCEKKENNIVEFKQKEAKKDLKKAA